MRHHESFAKALVRLPLGLHVCALGWSVIICFLWRSVAYGGVQHYLDNIGFNEDERDRLRAALSGSLSTPDVEPDHN
jgi:hypothetical protein